VFPPGDAREDWTIIRALSERLDAKLPFDNLNELRAHLYRQHPHFSGLDHIVTGQIADIEALAREEHRITDVGFGSAVEDFYQTNPIARASSIMAELSALTRENEQEATGTDG
jgi:NADH-quinone oxidoreductase subunit G